MDMTKEMIDAKLLQIAEFEKQYGTDHGQTSVNAMKKYCTDEKYKLNGINFQIQRFNSNI